MTSAAPARKPYRKAPPQHREVRHAPPVFRDDPPPQPEPCQVTRLPNRAPAPPPRPARRPRSPELFSSSWSLASESELDVSSLSSLDLTVLPPPRIFSHGPLAAPRPPGPARFASRSPDPLSPSPGPDRALVFSDRAEILAPREPSAAFLAPSPPKGILKQPPLPGGTPQPADSLRKSKSAEVLGQNPAYEPNPRYASLEGDQARSPPSPAGPPSPAPPLPGSGSGSAQAVRQLQVLEEKVRFSQFLDEITSRVLSPANIQLLGGRGPVDRRGKAAPPPPRQRPDPRARPDGRTRASEDRPEEPRPKPGEQPRKERERGGSRPQTWHVPLQRDSSDGDPEPEPGQRRGDAWREGARPKTLPAYRWMRGAEEAPRGTVNLRQHHRDPADWVDTSKCTYPVPLAEEDLALGSPVCLFSRSQVCTGGGVLSAFPSKFCCRQAKAGICYFQTNARAASASLLPSYTT